MKSQFAACLRHGARVSGALAALIFACSSPEVPPWDEADIAQDSVESPFAETELPAARWAATEAPLSGGAALPQNPGESSFPGSSPTQPKTATEVGASRVVLVSVDGLASRFVTRGVSNGQLPTFSRLQRAGAWTHNARTVVGRTTTLPNHISMLTGRPAVLHGEMDSSLPHLYLSNVETSESVTLHSAANPELGYLHSVFDVLHQHGHSTAFSAAKPKLDLLRRSWDRSQGKAYSQIRKRRGKMGYVRVGGEISTTERMSLLLKHLSEARPIFAFHHISDTDGAGHKHGWGSSEYDDALAVVDAELGRLLDFLADGGEDIGSRYLIVTTDHGGGEMTHGDTSDPNNFTIPFYLWGATVPPGVDLYDLVDSRRVEPGTEQLPFTPAQPQPIRNADAANLVLSLLQFSATVPGSVGVPLWAPPAKPNPTR